MRKLWRQALLLLAFNIFITVLAAAAFGIQLFRGDPVMAAVPAVGAFAGLIWQPWFFGFMFMPFGFFFAPFGMTAITMFVYRGLNTNGLLEGVNRVLAQIKFAPAAMAVALYFVIGSGIVYARYIDEPALNREAPERIKIMVPGIDQLTRNNLFYSIGNFIDREYLWQAAVSEKDLDILVSKLAMARTTQVPAEFFIQPPRWWPSPAGDMRAYATPSFPSRGRGQDGWHAFAVYRPEDGKLSVWVKDNF